MSIKMDTGFHNRNKDNKRSFSPFGSYAFVVGIIVVILISVGSIAYCTAAARRDIANARKRMSQTDTSRLTKVIAPNMADGEMLYFPGFDVYYSNDNRQPYYVSWALTPEHVRANNVSRSNNFHPEPSVSKSAELNDYRRSGFDRGHMAPAGDFKYSQEAQDATFSLANITPQHHDLNTRAWKNLEEQCRKWALRDSTLYIVCGPILSDYLTESIGDNKVTVPERFFKVVLAPYADPPRAIGFIMPNQVVPGGVQATVVTVDQVEEITGYDFFSELPDEIENAVESNSKYSLWQYKKK